ncbi:Na/Pi cotransporter family protein [Ralstonia solanacearum]|uniref:Na/Pi cotransporter family protein n=1 Tax=Ralstonia solanacearum TaxID=305 RepID=UPI0006DCBA38|nr:Na/Pi cotransporter family protein [Ralstonia solanacearum]
MYTLLKLLSGVALLVWGTQTVKVGMLRLYGADLRRLLSRSVSNRLSALLAGVGVTCLVQSSNATATIVGAFVAQGLMGVSSALAILLGANVGTALMAQVFALDLSWLSPLLIFFGVILHLSRKGSPVGHFGRVLIGLGLIMLALELIAVAASPMVEANALRVLLGSISADTGLNMLIGALLTLLCYSSLAVVLFCATLATSAAVSVKVAFAIVLGANIGSAVAALATTPSSSQAARRATLGNLLSRVLGAALVLPFLGKLAALAPHAGVALQHVVVAFHVLFNVGLALLLIGFTDRMAQLCTRILPGGRHADERVAPRYLDPSALATPTLALGNASREVLRIGDRVEHMLENTMRVLKTDDVRLLQTTRAVDDEVDALYTAIKLYLTQLSHEALDEREGRRWADIISLTINLEHAGDIIDRMLQDVREKKIEHKLAFSEAGLRELEDMHARLVANLRLALSVFLTGDLRSAQRLMLEKAHFRDLEKRYARSHLTRVSAQTSESIETSSLHLDIISDFKRLNSLFCAAAYTVLDEAGLLGRSRMHEADEAAADAA